VIPLCDGQAPGQRYRIEDAMSHDKTQAAARTRMAKTGEPYGAARRVVIAEHEAAEGQGLPGPHRDYLITLVGYGEGAGAGVPGAAVRDAASGRVVDRLPGRMDVYSAVAGSGGGRVFFLAMRFGRERIAGSDPEAGQIPPGGAVRVQLDDRGKIADLSAVPGVPEPAHFGPIHLAASADGRRLAYPVRRDRGGAPAADAPPSQISIVAVNTGERTVWQAESDGHIDYVSLSADGRRLAYSWHGLGEGNGIRVTDLPDTAAAGLSPRPAAW
jgi:WD40-like Beta Propeller Repeat